MGSAPRVEVGRVLAGNARATVFGVGVAAALALSGCSDGAGAQTGPTSSGPSTSATTSATASSSSTTSRPSSTAAVSIPAAARAHTEEGAKAFAKFYVEKVSESGYTADSSDLRAISEPTCKGCGVFIELADELKADGHHVDRESIVLRGLMIRPDSTEDRMVIDCLVEDLPSRIVDSNGKTVSEEPGDKLTLRNTLVWKDAGWVVVESLLVQG
jgi:hypothetical protein